jgi:DNA-binding NarL/FixJ family response regulator
MRTLNCMILDDETAPRERMAVLLSKIEGIRIISIEESPVAAIESISLKKPDLVFIDIEMPGMSGFDVVKEIQSRSLNPGFIFVTGYNQYAIKAIKSEAFDYLVKPVDIDELKESIDRFRCRFKEKIIHSTSKPENLPVFTSRELEIIRLIADCRTAKQIAEILHISKNTVDTHRKNILEKASLNKTSQLILYAMENGLG